MTQTLKMETANHNTQLFWQGYAQAQLDYRDDKRFTVKGQCNPTYYGIGYRTGVADLTNGFNRLA
jgi:hypothetical protein